MRGTAAASFDVHKVTEKEPTRARASDHETKAYSVRWRIPRSKTRIYYAPSFLTKQTEMAHSFETSFRTK